MSAQEANLAAVLPAHGADLVIQERSIPTPRSDEIVIRNRAIGLNPVDWKRQMFGFACPAYPLVLGADLAGTVVSVGSDVSTFKPGDRVFSFAHEFILGNNDNGAYQTYTSSKAGFSVRLPPDWTFEQGATLPTATAVATITLFDRLELPLPTVSATGTEPAITKNTGIIIWGGASTTGSMLIQFAHLSGLKVFTTASKKHHQHLKSLGASVTVDYKSPSAVEDIVAAAKEAGIEISLAADTISNTETLKAVSEILRKAGRPDQKKIIAYTVPSPENAAIAADGIEATHIPGQDIWTRRQDLGSWLCAEGGALSKWLAQGVIVPQRHRVKEQGLAGLQDGLNDLKRGAVSGEKLVVQV